MSVTDLGSRNFHAVSKKKFIWVEGKRESSTGVDDKIFILQISVPIVFRHAFAYFQLMC